MAVAGLRPQGSYSSCRSSDASNMGFDENNKNACGTNNYLHGGTHLEEPSPIQVNQQKQNLLCIVKFAINLMQVLNNINKQSFQAFKLRVGLNSGSVIAGVIGAQRPFYDIWGDSVNVSYHQLISCIE